MRAKHADDNGYSTRGVVALALWREARDLYAAVAIEGFDSRPAVEDCDRRIKRLETSS